MLGLLLVRLGLRVFRGLRVRWVRLVFPALQALRARRVPRANLAPQGRQGLQERREPQDLSGRRGLLGRLALWVRLALRARLDRRGIREPLERRARLALPGPPTIMRSLAAATRISTRSALSQGYRGRLTARFPRLTSDCRMLVRPPHTSPLTAQAARTRSLPPISVQQKRHMFMVRRISHRGS